MSDEQVTYIGARARYRGRPAYVRAYIRTMYRGWPDEWDLVCTRDGSRLLLISPDGRREWWAPADQVDIRKVYRLPTTLERLAEIRDIRSGRKECDYCREHGDRLARTLDTCPVCGRDYDA